MSRCTSGEGALVTLWSREEDDDVAVAIAVEDELSASAVSRRA